MVRNLSRTQKQIKSEAKAHPQTDSYRHSNVTSMTIDRMAGMGINNGPGAGAAIDIDGFLNGTSNPHCEVGITLSHRQAKWLRDQLSEILEWD